MEAKEKMWKLKILVQFFLSKTFKGESINFFLQRLHKSFSEEQISTNIREHVRIIKKIQEYGRLDGAVTVEIGTGWIPYFAVLFHLAGVKSCHSYDHLPHVRFALIPLFLYCLDRQLVEIAEAISVPINVVQFRLGQLRNCRNLDALFAKAHTHYHAPGDASRTGLADCSVDLVVSNAVLEHVPENTVFEFTMEARRILKKTGIGYHFIGLHDHYANPGNNLSKVNFLKYSSWLWSFFVLNDISYHNRLRLKQFIVIFKRCRASLVDLKTKSDPKDIDALRKMKIDKTFREMTLDELAVYQAEILFTFPEKNSKAG
jgi:hypothetical protein